MLTPRDQQRRAAQLLENLAEMARLLGCNWIQDLSPVDLLSEAVDMDSAEVSCRSNLVGR